MCQFDTGARLPQTLRLSDDRLQSSAWPGGYPLLYIVDGDLVCPDCANNYEANDEPPATGWFIHYEGPPEVCSDCGVEIDSAYGDPADDDSDSLTAPSAEPEPELESQPASWRLPY